MYASSGFVYNCSSPIFGLFCQYSLQIDHSADESLNEMIDVFYQDQCYHGQWISKRFFHDHPNTFECLDRSHDPYAMMILDALEVNEPTFALEEITCPTRHRFLQASLSNSCRRRTDVLLIDLLLSDVPDSLILKRRMPLPRDILYLINRKKSFLFEYIMIILRVRSACFYCVLSAVV